MAGQGITRRKFIGAMGAGVATVASGAAFWAAATSSRKPNILVIMSDEHNARILGCMGNALAQTPHLDALAQHGVVFENAYCNSPLCVPSRQSFTSGKYCSRVNAWNNNSRMPNAAPSLPRVLNTAGYQSFLCGKMHYDTTCRYGFTELGGNLNWRTLSNLGEPRRVPDDLTPKPGYNARFHEFNTADTTPGMEHDQKVTRVTSEFLRQRKASDPPFFYLAGYIAPHFPLIIPKQYWEPYKGKIPMPALPEHFEDRLALNYKHLRIGFDMEDVPGDVVQKGRELYYGFVQWVDSEIGKVLQTLHDSEVADNTVVIYTADHGENMGEHGLWWKNCMYDTAAHVPLIISWPARWHGGQRRTQVCSLVDAVQTIAALGGADVPDDWNGDSMLPWLDDAQLPWKDVAVSEYYAHFIASGFAMIRMGGYKYVYHSAPDQNHPAYRELYDLSRDPDEWQNLAEKPEQAERLTAMHAALVKEIGEDPEATEQRCRACPLKG